MLTHLHVMVKHMECQHICKGSKGGEEGDEVLPLGAPPPPVWCTTTPVTVTSRGGREGGVLGGTATLRAVPT